MGATLDLRRWSEQVPNRLALEDIKSIRQVCEYPSLLKLGHLRLCDLILPTSMMLGLHNHEFEILINCKRACRQASGGEPVESRV